ncbi:exopolyphosphatase [Uliginosibacterium sp. H1]|uniref:exopolyphosphatase n=1 Tax=Uliginosibacterium sp. H1 TaxID=3114757 RepID=UPI002E175D0D|nr:exopolyphosphatase [Uliginosibacterium sp. H1]
MFQKLVCAVDLGSNSFRLLVGRIVGDQIYPLDGLKESVRLAAGLGSDKQLDAAARERALEALRRFNERIRNLPPDAVRAVATNTLRVAKNAPQFLLEAEEALGFPIEVIAGREEARLIYVGVAHTLPDPTLQQLVVDIGGGSTEFIIGRNFEPIQLESLYMGCVGYSLRYFPGGYIEKQGLKEAELAARNELQAIANPYRETGWDQAVGSSGSAKSIADVLEQSGWSSGGITREGLEKLRSHMLRAGHVDKLDLPGIKGDRLPVFAGGFSILYALFKEFDLEHMVFSDGALRLGVLYDLLGRYHRHDLRDATVQAFRRRYQVDVAQADSVSALALALFAQQCAGCEEEFANDRRFLDWAAQLHEIGLSVAHSSYHKHTAYILGNADMPGFSRMDQGRLARLALAHRGKLERVQSLDPESTDWLLILCLRLACIVHRARSHAAPPPLRLQRDGQGFMLAAPQHWLQESPLTHAALQEEQQHWARLGKGFRVKAERAVAAAG